VALYALSHLLDDLKRKYQIRPDPGKAQRNDAARHPEDRCRGRK
jgi:hypothetical protein